MTLIESPIQSEIHLVEVSGWDENEMFFVETCDLDWDDFAGKHISLQHMLPEGAMVFLRILQPVGASRTQPNVFAVEFLGCNVDGHHEFRLNPVHPRHSRQKPSVN
jgi:hypothetical protein